MENDDEIIFHLIPSGSDPIAFPTNRHRTGPTPSQKQRTEWTGGARQENPDKRSQTQIDAPDLLAIPRSQDSGRARAVVRLDFLGPAFSVSVAVMAFRTWPVAC